MMLAWIKRNKYLLGFLIAVIAIGYFGYGYYKSSTEVKETVRTATVEYGHLSDSISATGSLSAVDNVDISSKITGRIVEVCVEENDHVNAGQVLVRLDDTSLAATQTQMQAKMENALATYNRYSALLAKGAISKSDYDLAEADYTVAKANYDQATSNVNDTVITTPISGYVIGKPTPVGQTISSGISEPQVIMSIANLDNMQIETMVDESDIGQVKVGQKVNFTVDSYPDRTFEGIVRLVSRKAVTENNVIYYTVYVDVANSEGKLLPTMTARANIIVNEADGVLMVPANCLRTEGSRRYVQVYNEATKEIRNVDVEVGLSGDDKIAVSSLNLKKAIKFWSRPLKQRKLTVIAWVGLRCTDKMKGAAHMTAVIRLEDIMKTYVMGDAVVHALDHVSVEIGVGEFTSIMGPSGSGKSTMMNILGCLDRPTSGQYYLDGKEVAGYSDDELARTRNAKIGFVFQNFNLLPKLSAQLNVALPLVYAGIGEEERLERAKTALEAVGLGDRIDHNPTEMSGGQRQRVAIARALINDPAIIMADEPTGNLDSRNGKEVMDLLTELNSEGTTIVMVTHSQKDASVAQRTINLFDGQIVSDVRNEL